MKSHFKFRDLKTGELFTVELDIDLTAIAQALAARALKNRSGKAASLNGDVKCKVIERGPA